MNAAFLLGLGFIVGFSGAMIPGPLLVYTIAQSLRKGWKTGFHVILGHAMVEIALMLLLLAGVSAIMTSDLFNRTIGIVGGAMMAYMAWTLHRSKWTSATYQPLKYGSITGGIIFTAFNPGFPIWWAMVGAQLLLEGMREGGLVGAGLVLAGHWGADFGYYTTVSALISKGKEKILKDYVERIKDFLAAALFFIGAYFILNVLWPA